MRLREGYWSVLPDEPGLQATQEEAQQPQQQQRQFRTNSIFSSPSPPTPLTPTPATPSATLSEAELSNIRARLESLLPGEDASGM